MLSNIRKHALGEVAAPKEKKPREYRESSEQRQVVKWLRERPNWLVMRVENAAKRTGAQYQRDHAMGMEPGAPDLIVMFHTFTFYLEMKEPRGRLSEEQVKLHRQLRARGMPVAIGFGAEATIAALTRVEELWSRWDEDEGRTKVIHLRIDKEHRA